MITRHLRTSCVSTCIKILKGREKQGECSSKSLASKVEFLGRIFFTRAQVEVPDTVVQVSRQRRRISPTVQTLGRKVLGQYRRSLGTVRSWDSGLGTVVLGQCSLGMVLGQCSLGTTLGQCGLGTVQSWDWSWDSSLGTVVLGQWSWDSTVLEQYSTGTVILGRYGLGTVVIGQWSWDSTVLGQCSLGTVVLGQYSLGTVVLGQCSLGTLQSWDGSLGTVESWDSSRKYWDRTE